ncbi:MAG: insulinase family protein [Opitutales bacterium]|nr:insulinase family protein [Opitutales bacterium]
MSHLMPTRRRNKANSNGAWVLLAGLAISLFGSLPSLPADVFAHERSDLEADPAVHFGTLENGLRYAILQHNEPPRRISLRLLVQVGSLMEEDVEQGMAHYLEHMGFKGSTHFSPGEMIELGQRLGMDFGPDTNAHTAFHETVYKFEVPTAADEMLLPTFQALRDYADQLLILEEETETERGVILAEMLDRDSPSFRSLIDSFRFLMPHTLFHTRLPIGIEETVRTMNHEDIRAFYDRWYTTDRMAVIIVGDIEPGRARELLEEYFGSMAPNPDPLPDPKLGTIVPRGQSYHFYHDPELPGTEVSVSTVRLTADPTDTFEARVESYLANLARLALNRRLARIAEEEDAPFRSASSYTYSFMNFADIAGIDAVTNPDTWPAALERITLEKRRALEYGFSESEIALVAAEVLNAAETAAARAPSRESRQIADSLSASISRDRVFRSPAQDLVFAQSIQPYITPENVHAVFADAWSPTDRFVRLESETDITGAFAIMRATFRGALALPVAAPEDLEIPDFAYTRLGEPGEIVERVPVEGLDAERVVFANNVVLHLKRTDFEQNRIRLGARFGSGRLGLRPEIEGLDMFATYTFTAGGLVSHSADELSRIFAGKTVSANLVVEDDAFSLRGETTPRDLRSQLDLLAAAFVAPGFRPEAERRFRQFIPQIYQQVNHTVDGVAAKEMAAFLAGGDFRFGLPDRATLEQRTTAELREWFMPYLSEGPLEIAVVGDFDPDTLVEAVRATFGALPARARQLDIPAEARRVDFHRGGEARDFRYTTQIPRARATVHWVTDDQMDILRNRRLSILGGVISDRLRVEIRNRLGETYSPFAFHNANRVFEGYGHLIAIVNTEAEFTARAIEIMEGIAEDLRENGISEDEFVRVLQPRLKSLEDQYRSNPYWLSVLLGAAQNPHLLEWSRTLFVDFPSITREQVEELARQYLLPERALRIRILPVAMAPPADSDDEADSE